MKTFFFSILFLSVLYSCQSNQKPMEITQSPLNNKVKLDYFIGNWTNTNTFIFKNNQKIEQVKRPCDEASYWSFYMKNELLFQSAFTAHGQDCKVYSQNDESRVDITNGMLNYFVNDVGYSLQFIVRTPYTFSIITRDLQDGQIVQVERVYKKISDN